MITLAGVPKVTGHNQYAGPGQSFTNILVNIQHLDHRVFKARMTDSGGNTVGFPYTNIPVDQSTNYTIYISIDPTSGSSGPSQVTQSWPGGPRHTSIHARSCRLVRRGWDDTCP